MKTNGRFRLTDKLRCLGKPIRNPQSAPRFALANVLLGEQIRGGLGKPIRWKYLI
jgi:hypothetical protein